MPETNSSNDEALINLPDLFLSSNSASEEIVIPKLRSKLIVEQSSIETLSSPSTSKMANLPIIEQPSVENLDILITRELQTECHNDLYVMISKNYKVAIQAMTSNNATTLQLMQDSEATSQQLESHSTMIQDLQNAVLELQQYAAPSIHSHMGFQSIPHHTYEHLHTEWPNITGYLPDRWKNVDSAMLIQ
ncbi:hypothetical protein K7432_016919, partial [Basidiobolus ranarum]